MQEDFILSIRGTENTPCKREQTFDFTVDNTAGCTTSGTVDVQIPAGVSGRVDVRTR